MALVFQIIILVFALFAISRVVLRFKEKQVTIGPLLFWVLLWIGVIVFFFLPGLSDVIAHFLGLELGSNLLIYASVLFLFYFCFRLYVKLEKIERNITQLVRNISIKNSNSKKVVKKKK